MDWAKGRPLGIAAIFDCLAWPASLALATTFRFEFDFTRIDLGGIVALGSLLALAQVVVGHVVGLYLGRWRFGSFDEVAALAKVASATTVIGLVVNALNAGIGGTYPVPRTVPIIAGAISLVAMATIRYSWRFRREQLRRPTIEGRERLLVFGAGEGGAQVITAMLRDPDSPYFPVALLDDDVAKRNLRISDVHVSGTRDDLIEVAERLDADSLLIAIPSASNELVAGLTDLAHAAGLAVKVLPPTKELFGAPGLDDIRSLDPSDLLGRHEVDTDLSSIASYLTGKRVLVTGAGGSIGSELCRQIYRFAPSELIMLDRDESALHAVQLSIEGRAMLDTNEVVLADIRDGKAIEMLFEERRPDVVFHAAALKHLPLLEQYPGEALQTNVWGTLNVLMAAAWSGVERFVNISTDKAADPTSVLGYSKRIAECLTAYVTRQTSGTYLSVRFGNVLGSRGSMLTTFQSQIAAGGPVTVTDPEVTRFFMTIQEACELVIQAGAVGNDGEALVLDMGEPVRIADVARRLASEAPRKIDIVYTGLRPGEKLQEVLFGAGEVDYRPVHPLISHVRVPPVGPAGVLALDPRDPPNDLVKRFIDLANTTTDRSARQGTRRS